MKKLILAALLLIGSASVSQARVENCNATAVTLKVRIKKPVSGGNPMPKSPAAPPDVSLDDNTLFIDGIGDETTILLEDATGTVVYSAVVSDGATSIILPAWLSGEYMMTLIPTSGNYYFYGWIEL